MKNTFQLSTSCTVYTYIKNEGASTPGLLVCHFVPYTRQAGRHGALGYVVNLDCKLQGVIH